MGTYIEVLPVGANWVGNLVEFEGRLYSSTEEVTARSNIDWSTTELTFSNTAWMTNHTLANFDGDLYHVTRQDFDPSNTWKINATRDGWEYLFTHVTPITELIVFDGNLYAAVGYNVNNAALLRLNALKNGWDLVAEYGVNNQIRKLAIYNNRLYATCSSGALPNAPLLRLNIAKTAWELVCTGPSEWGTYLGVYNNKLYLLFNVSGSVDLYKLNDLGTALDFVLSDTGTTLASFSECYGRLYLGSYNTLYRLNVAEDGLEAVITINNAIPINLVTLSNNKLYFSCLDTNEWIANDYYKYNSVDVDFSADVTSGYDPLTVNFSQFVSSDFPIISYAWDFGDGYLSTEANPTHIYDPGLYTISLVVTNAYDSNTHTKTDYINVAASLHITYDGNGNTGGTAPVDSIGYPLGAYATVLSEGSLVREGRIFYNWNTSADGSGSAYAVSDSIYVDDNITLYAQWLYPPCVNSYWDIETSGQATSAGGEGKTTAEMKTQSTFVDWDFNSVWQIVNNETYPQFMIATFTANVLSGATPLTVTFTNTSGLWPLGLVTMTHDWDFGDGSLHSSLINPVHTYSNPGTYTVTLIETRDYVQDTRVKIAYITVGGGVFVADFIGAPRTNSKSAYVEFVDMSLGDFSSWNWDFGDGTFSNERNPVHFYSHPGLFTVSLTTSGISGTYNETKQFYISVTSLATYDIAPDPGELSYLQGKGSAVRLLMGVEIKRY